jgi:hypothetical protein
LVFIFGMCGPRKMMGKAQIVKGGARGALAFSYQLSAFSFQPEQ